MKKKQIGNHVLRASTQVEHRFPLPDFCYEISVVSGMIGSGKLRVWNSVHISIRACLVVGAIAQHHQITSLSRAISPDFQSK
jgi:hypothetical protein